MRKSLSVSLEILIKSKRVLLTTLGVFTVLIVGSLFQLKKVTTHYSLKQFQPKNHVALQRADEIKEKFLVSDLSPYIIAFETKRRNAWDSDENLDILAGFSEKLEEHDLVESVNGLNNIPIAVVSDDTFSVGTLKDVAGPRGATKNTLLSPHFISQNGKSSAMVVTPMTANSQDKIALYNYMVKELKGLPDTVSATVGGPSAITSRMTFLFKNELTLFTSMALLLTALMLLLLFRGYVAPMLCVGLVCISILCSVALMAMLGMPFTVLSNTVPILIAITVIAMVSHSLVRINELAPRLRGGKEKVVLKVFSQLVGPHALTAITTAIGFGTLIPSDVPVIRDFGLSVVMSVLLTCVICLTCLPLAFYWLPLPQRRSFTLEMSGLFSLVREWKVPVLVGFVALMISVSTSLHGLNWSSLLLNDLPEGDPTKYASVFVDSELGGTLSLDIMVTGSSEKEYWKQPESLAKLETLVEAVRGFGAVGSVMSITDFLKASEEGGGLPKTTQRVAEKYLLYGMGEENPIESFLTPNKNSTRVALRMRDVPSNEMIATVGQIEKLGQRLFPGDEVVITGAAVTTHVINQEISRRLMFGFFTALFWIFLLLAIVFRSLTLALVSVVPNLMPPTILITVLALTATPIQPGIAIIFSISLGIAFDNTVYLLSSLQRELKHNTNPLMALKATLSDEAEACLLSGLCLMAGFSVFVFSYFAMNQVFGLFMLLSIGSGLFGDLILLPSLLSLFPRLMGGVPVRKSETQTGEGLPNVA